MTSAIRMYPAKPEKVYIYATCLVDLFSPQSGLDAIKLLERAGVEIIYILEQTCCGQPERIFELTEFLVHVCRIKLVDKGAATSVVLHTSCAARREMKVHITSRQLLAQLEAVELREQAYESECCGFGGTFAVRHAAISEAMVNDKTQHLNNTHAEQLISADWGCLLNINGAQQYQGNSLRGIHLASFLINRVEGSDAQ